MFNIFKYTANTSLLLRYLLIMSVTRITVCSVQDTYGSFRVWMCRFEYVTQHAYTLTSTWELARVSCTFFFIMCDNALRGQLHVYADYASLLRRSVYVSGLARVCTLCNLVRRKFTATSSCNC